MLFAFIERTFNSYFTSILLSTPMVWSQFVCFQAQKKNVCLCCEIASKANGAIKWSLRGKKMNNDGSIVICFCSWLLSYIHNNIECEVGAFDK